MASTYSTSLRLELIGTGDQSGTWGTTTNTNLGTLLEQAITGVSNVSMTSDADYTLTTVNGGTDQSRQAVLNITSTVSLTATRNIIIPSVNKIYIVKNGTSGSQSLTIKTSSGTGITVKNGYTTAVYCNGTNVYQAIDYLPSVTIDSVLFTDVLGVGSAALSSVNAYLNTALSSSATAQYGLRVNTTPSVSATSAQYGVISSLQGATGSSGSPYTTDAVYGLRASAYVPGTYQTVTTQYGVSAAGMSTATFNYAFYSNTSGSSSVSLSSISRASNVVSVATATSHGLAVGDTVVISSATSSFNGIFTVTTAGTTTTFQYNQTGSNETGTASQGYSTKANNWNYYSASSAPNYFNGPAIISANSGMDGLRITQAGSGNALVVEDSTNPDSTPFVIDASGNVGIGTSSPAAILDVYQSSIGTYLRVGTSSTARQLLFSSSTTTNAGDTHTINASSGSGIIAFATNNTECMRIRSDGGVSIGGTGASSVGLYLQKNITGATTSYGLLANGSVQNDVTLNAFNFLSQSNIASGTAVTTYAHFRTTEGTISGSMTNQYGFISVSDLISATTNVGFYAGNTAAVGAGKTAYGFYSAVNTATGGGTTYGFYAAGTANNYFAGNVGIGTSSPNAKLDVLTTASTRLLFTERSTGGNVIDSVNGSNTAYAQFLLNGSPLIFATGATERMRIDASGNVGIGITPARKFDVAGGARFVQDAAATTGAIVLRQNSGDTVGGFIQWVNNANTAEKGWMTVDTSSNMLFATGSSERMRIDSSGNVGIGTTSTLANSSLNVSQGVVARNSGATTGFFQLYNDTAGTDLKTWRIGNLSSGIIKFETVNDAYTVATERMRVDSSGNTYIETGTLWQYAPAPTAKSAAATLTAAELQTGIIVGTGTSYTLTMPTGTNIDAAFTGVPTTGIGFDFFVVSGASGTITMAVNTGVTNSGGLTIGTGQSAHFRLRRTAANTYVMYRLS